MDWDPNEFFSKIDWDPKLSAYNLSFAMDDWEIGLLVLCDSKDDTSQLAKAAKLLLATFENIDSFYREISSKLLQTYNDSWSDGVELTEDDFAERITLESIYVRKSDAAVYFADDDLFGGHSIVVEADDEANPLTVALEG